MNKQSENNTQFDTGAQRDDRTGKLCMSLLPHGPLNRIMERYLDGAKEYGENNWTKGMPYSALYDSAQRHMMQWWSGDNSEDHLAAAAWNIMGLMYFEGKLPTPDEPYGKRAPSPEFEYGLDDRQNFPVD
tara:strand:+ start:825 stop:1214 length:390 start_codon:yes stop_codon:yes gene_type:complete